MLKTHAAYVSSLFLFTICYPKKHVNLLNNVNLLDYRRSRIFNSDCCVTGNLTMSYAPHSTRNYEPASEHTVVCVQRTLGNIVRVQVYVYIEKCCMRTDLFRCCKNRGVHTRVRVYIH